ncbi:nucleotidyl transferase AbiEii/AbiGii toxin family protein [Variovorax paradoxus]|uniref:nucleotidyl transferase AbiEii/AbiGii toxin family protein n=1 Tax=Variovorax paradoxus TaxID=34073 RepID=UPI002480D3F4|nr:nucleotidyl transferase AbiEii/AbiGii toxin family protein [Variovorax paradoxus]WGT63736.1 nucleotidyl transferase AbiEii/AbiGii toxin family protein [Variovorax paradoxus]
MVGPPLTEPNFEVVDCQGRPIRVETSAEVIAKKMWHRGSEAKARDLFDLCAVATFEPEAIDIALPHRERHAAAFLRRLEDRAEATELEFDMIQSRSFQMSFWEGLTLAHTILAPILPPKEAGKHREDRSK